MIEPDVLLLTEPAQTAAPAAWGGQQRVQCATDPYEALLRMERRRWSAVVLTAPRRDFASLCRASRRLQPASAVIAICPPAGEPEVRRLVGTLLTDYFITPPTRRDVQTILDRADEVARSVPAGPQGAMLSPRELSALLEACHSLPDLEAAMADLLGRRLGCPVQWSDAAEAPPGASPLLLTAGDTPRVLVTASPAGALPEEAQAFLRVFEQYLPALTATAQRTETLHRLAITDPLTGAYNRRYFYHITDEILRRAGESQFRATLLLYDIDDFKHYNDTFGYATGDEILREMATLMKRTSRKQDIVARIGGDEFAMLYWDFDAPRHPGSQPPRDAYMLAERFLHAVRQHDFAALGPDGRGALGISGGLATFPDDGATCRDLLRSADKALKRAKRAGKNSIQLVDRGSG